MCRIGFVETVRAVGLVAGHAVVRSVEEEWPAFAVVEVDQRLASDAAQLTVEHGLRSLDALHLGAALALPQDELLLATWDKRSACRRDVRRGFRGFPRHSIDR